MSTVGRSVRLYLVDGTSTGILTAEIMNWTGHVLAGPRTRLEAALGREELKRTGVYILFGSDGSETDRQKVYVGESDEIAKRLYQHNRDETKEFWERFIAVTSKDLNLTKAHVKYLEARLLDLVHAAKKSVVANKDNPSFDRLPEADTADMENFLSQIELILPVIGVEFLKKPRTNLPKMETSGGDSPVFHSNSEVDDSLRSNPRFELKNVGAGINATATEVDGEFIVLAGSSGSLQEKSSFSEKLKSIRDDALVSERIRKTSEKNFQVVEDIALSSPSAAAVFLFGTSRNGRTDWIEKATGQNYGNWKDELIKSHFPV